jgi:ABC-type antimicrobial peptide transport system permease subunit
MAFLAVGWSGADLPLTESLRREIGLENPQVTMIAIDSLDASVRQLAAEPLFRVWLIGLLAGLAIVVSAAGLYGVVAHSVAARTSEVGVRLALGSTPGDVVSLMMGEGLLLATVGLALGLCGAIAATRAIRTLLFGVAPLDLASFATASMFLLCVTALRRICPRAVRGGSIPWWHSGLSRASGPPAARSGLPGRRRARRARPTTPLRYFSTSLLTFPLLPLLYFSTSNRLILCAAPYVSDLHTHSMGPNR